MTVRMTSTHVMHTSGETDPVWVHTLPFEKFPTFKKLQTNLAADVCVIGSGIAGVSTSYELVSSGLKVVMLEARDFCSGETGRTSGHLSMFGYSEIEEKHGADGKKVTAASHGFAMDQIGRISSKLNIDCEYRRLPAYQICMYPRSDKNYNDEMKELEDEAKAAKTAGVSVSFDPDLKVKGWNGSIDQPGGVVFDNQATFHPTKYVCGVMKWLAEQPNFACYTETRVLNVEEKGIEVLGIGSKEVKISTEEGHVVTCKNAVEACTVPLQKLSVVAEMEFMRTYCIAMKIPKGTMEDCLLYDSDDPYVYARLTACDAENQHIIVGGKDHKVGQEQTTGRFSELEAWTRKRFPQVTTLDYAWSGQVFESVDHVAFIGKNQGMDHVYVITGDCGNGLTHGVLAGKLVSDEIQGIDNPWAKLYNPKRLASIIKSLPSMLQHDVQINAQYKRFLQSDIQDIEDLPRGCGGVLNTKSTSKPVAVYKSESGQVQALSAICPHLKAVVSWNDVEKSWDCPVHGSRFSADGICVMGPSKANMVKLDQSAIAKA